jgi:hypothetical protein
LRLLSLVFLRRWAGLRAQILCRETTYRMPVNNAPAPRYFIFLVSSIPRPIKRRPPFPHLMGTRPRSAPPSRYGAPTMANFTGAGRVGSASAPISLRPIPRPLASRAPAVRARHPHRLPADARGLDPPGSC